MSFSRHHSLSLVEIQLTSIDSGAIDTEKLSMEESLVLDTMVLQWKRISRLQCLMVSWNSKTWFRVMDANVDLETCCIKLIEAIQPEGITQEKKMDKNKEKRRDL